MNEPVKFAKSSKTQPRCQVVLKFNLLLHYRTFEVTEYCKIHFPSNLHVRWRTAPKFSIFDRYNSAADCSISLKFGTEFDNVTTDILQTFKVKESKVKVTW